MESFAVSQDQYKWDELLALQNFSWAKFDVVMKAKENCRLPAYKGSTIRGGFGAAFKKVCCTVKNDSCRKCILAKNCSYAYIFETPNLEQNNHSNKSPNLPHPFIIEPLDNEKICNQKDEKLVFRLILLGKSIPLLPYFIYAFDSMAKKGLGMKRNKFELTSVYTSDNLAGGYERKIYDIHSQILDGNINIWKLTDLYKNKKSDKITINFLTPTRIINNNTLTSNISFGLLIRNLCRRISLLGKIHCDSDWDLPYNEIINQATQNVKMTKNNIKWVDWERYSNRQKRKMKLGGITGIINYEGDIKPFLPLLFLGEIIHVGKNTTFGLGKYRSKCDTNKYD